MTRRAILSLTIAVGCAAALLLAQAPAANSAAVLDLSATTANVAGAPDTVRVEILRWSTDEERDRLMAAWELRSSQGGRGAAKAGAAKGGGKQAKGAAKGAEPAAAALTPEASLAQAIQDAPTVGYLWSSEIAGYALRYAGKVANPDGTQRVILLTQRRLGANNQRWASSGPENTYEFSAIELRLNAKGEGEGKASLTGKIAADSAARIVTVENYNSLPVVLRDVRTRAARP